VVVSGELSSELGDIDFWFTLGYSALLLAFIAWVVWGVIAYPSPDAEQSFKSPNDGTESALLTEALEASGATQI
jgi:hypothetical protein